MIIRILLPVSVSEAQNLHVFPLWLGESIHVLMIAIIIRYHMVLSTFYSITRVSSNLISYRSKY